MPVTRRITVHGRVQGVWFRGWTVDQARALGLRGWVRNRTDGSVEMLVSGDEEAVKTMIALCNRGPSAARVEHVDVEEAEADEPEGFEQRTTA
jgi:acylphosphatase